MNGTDYDIGILMNGELGDDLQSDGCCPSGTPARTNAFVDIEGYPYLLDEYLENIDFRPIDQANISNDVSISNTDSGRSIVDISIDHSKPVLGNRIKYGKLVEDIFRTVRVDRQNILPVLQRVLIVQISYQLENQRTGRILKSATERLAITTRDYFLDLNVRSISDNAIDNSVVTNFVDSLTTTVTEFLHGSETMICRLTGIDLFYPAIMHHPHHHHHIPADPTNYNPVCKSYRYNDLYHFDNGGTDIHLHPDEIEGIPGKDVSFVPIGSVKFDKVFNVNTGHRITFKFSVWKSDIIMVKNTKRIEEILGGAPYRKFYKTIEDILDRLDDIKATNSNQDAKLDDITKRLDNTMSEDQAAGVGSDIINAYNSTHHD